MLKIDDTDEKLIRMLSEDSRKSYKEIADKLGLSIITVRKRLQKLVDEEIIKKFTIILNPELFKNKIISLVTIHPAAHRQNEIIETIAKLEEVEEAHLMTGGCGLSMKVHVNSLIELNKFIEKVRGIQGVISVESCIVLRKVKG
ncbi:MAG: Lrp/AsnC family transcriptional regulator [Candidatus Jordarchaeum sp.]|uniref:Lrp/AsnC family transcriptional regulator n=1 Tax=Candidatus Jordarchaeum sp. TaxID=2823881 RepID=UPI00404B59A3